MDLIVYNFFQEGAALIYINQKKLPK